MNLYLDVETVPANDPALLELVTGDLTAQLATDLDSVAAPSNYKDEEKIASYISERQVSIMAAFQKQRDEAIARTALDGAFARICCFSMARNDEEPATVYGNVDTVDAERELLSSAFQTIEYLMESSRTKPKVIGHNISGFDLRVIWQRAVVLGLRPPRLPFYAKPWDDSIGDTMIMWNPSPGARISLDKLCRVLRVPTPKQGFGGADVWPAYQRGEYARIGEYCAGDVIAMRECYKAMRFGVSDD